MSQVVNISKKMYKLTKEGLRNSSYYCAASIDLQPLLRFGDITSDFIYVSVGIKKEKFIEGIKSYVENLNTQQENKVLTINSISDFKLTDIEHPKQGQLINRIPEYINSNDFRAYLNTFDGLRKNTIHYNLHIKFTLKIGNIVKPLNLFYITGEALATYEAIFVSQDIAPKIFISIQSGLIEIPSRFTNKMFESHSQRPKVWIRGVWTEDPYGDVLGIRDPDNVFTLFGLYNKKIGEFRNWDSQMGVKIEETTDNSKKYRVVMAYGESKCWINTENDEIISERDGVKVRKLFKSLNHDFEKDYTVGKYSQLLDELNVLEHNKNNYLDRIYLEYVFFANNYDTEKIYQRAIIPYGFEAEEAYISLFVETFQIVNNIQLHIDIYYRSELDFNRDF